MLAHGSLAKSVCLQNRPRYWPADGQQAKSCSSDVLQADVPRSVFWSHVFVTSGVSMGGVAAFFCRSQRRHRLKQARGAHLACFASRTEASTVQQFVDWMDTTGIVTSKKLQILPDQEDGRCVKCIDTIAKGEVLVQLPEASAVSVDMSETANPGPDLAPLADWWSRHTRSSIRLAAALVFQREKFGPYLDMLYPMENIYAPWLWEDQDLKFLPDGLAASAAARKKALESACKDLKAGGLAEQVPEELFLRAHHAAASRAFAGEGDVSTARTAALACGALTLTAAGAAAAAGVVSIDAAASVGALGVAASGAAVALSDDAKVLSLLPMIDQINHKSGAPPDLQFDPGSRRWELRALRTYSAGEEIFFSYGDKDSDSLLLQHGFVEQDNGADKLTLPVPAAGSHGLSAEAKSELEALGVKELIFARDGSLLGLTEATCLGASSENAVVDIEMKTASLKF
ncbi:Setd3 [Symbiodinium natans]|uniref:Setd3 protein n=1 Tax=Symbiodinium natans TaxID=878477 RepID=A0A812J4A6_9DINO|nr:Setd3 [Symbiodinium natans]